MEGGVVKAMGIVIDRIEGDIAVVEIAGRCVDIPLTLLPDDSSEGGSLTFTRGCPVGLLDAEARLARLKSRKPEPGYFDI